MNNWVGKRLGKVQIESLVGRGGLAEVYVGTHATLGHKVAVKILRNFSEEDSDALSRFEREAQVIAKLRHSNIVHIHDFDTVDHQPYLVMEYIEGPSLSKYLNSLHQRNQRLPLLQVVRLMNAIASALQYAHSNGVIHRDIKPGNILLTSISEPIVIGKPLPEDFEPILTDFGLVRLLDPSHASSTGHIVGTPAYMSPEQSRGEKTDPRTDVYSLGIVLYELLAGHPPFEGESTISILFKQLNEPPPPIPGLSPFIETVLKHTLAKEAKDRYQTPIDFADAFEEAVQLSSNYPTAERPILPSKLAVLKTEEPGKFKPRWMRLTLPLTLIIAISGFLFVNNLQASPATTVTPTMPSITDTIPASATPTDTSTPLAALPAGPTGLLHFQNASALADEVFINAQGMPAPPPDAHYEFWLIGAAERVSLGTFSPDETGKGQLIFSDAEGTNLFAIYDRTEVTIEPQPDTDPNTSGLVAYAFTFPAEELVHLRYLLSSYPNTPGKIGLVQGLYTNIQQIANLAKEMQAILEDGNKELVLQKGESALNLLVGEKSVDYKDWNGDGLTEPSDSFGLLVNGSNFGYIQAVYAEADYIVNTTSATQFMIDNGEVVKTCTQNLTLWIPQVRKLLLTILTSTSEAEVRRSIDDLVEVVDRLLHGVDLEGDGSVDTIPGECGADLAYNNAYSMADMPFLPVSISYQLTAIVEATHIVVAPTKNRSDSQNNNPVVSTSQPAAQPTANSGNPGNSNNPRPTRIPRPTKTPKR
jgi:serine/threonine protein kinase